MKGFTKITVAIVLAFLMLLVAGIVFTGQNFCIAENVCFTSE